jgi:hypothetical protein
MMPRLGGNVDTGFPVKTPKEQLYDSNQTDPTQPRTLPFAFEAFVARATERILKES